MIPQLFRKKPVVLPTEAATLEQIFDYLADFAFVDLFNHESDNTWAAVATMRINVKGGAFKLRARGKSAKEALVELVKLVDGAVKQLGR